MANLLSWFDDRRKDLQNFANDTGKNVGNFLNDVGRNIGNVVNQPQAQRPQQAPRQPAPVYRQPVQRQTGSVFDTPNGVKPTNPLQQTNPTFDAAVNTSRNSVIKQTQPNPIGDLVNGASKTITDINKNLGDFTRDTQKNVAKFGEYANPLGDKGIFGTEQQQTFKQAVKPVINTLENYNKAIDSTDHRQGFQWNDLGDYGRFAAKLPSGMAQGLLEAPTGVAEAMTGKRMDDGQVKDINAIQRAGSLANSVIGVGGIGFGGSKTLLEQAYKQAAKQGLGTTGKAVLKDAGKEGIEETAQALANDLSDDGVINNDLSSYRDAAALGTLGGGMMSGAGKVVNGAKNIVNPKPNRLEQKIIANQSIPNSFQDNNTQNPINRYKTAPISDNNLLVTHNIAPNSLLFADKTGGIAMPSVGIVNPSKGVIDSYGEISLVGDKKLVTPNKSTQVFNSDIYSPRYPRVQYATNEKNVNSIAAEMQKHGIDQYEIDRFLDDANDASNIEYAGASKAVTELYAKRNGIDTSNMTGTEVASLRETPEYASFQKSINDSIMGEGKFVDYNPDTGKSKYHDLTAQNALKLMRKSNLQGGENFNYGVASSRARIAKQFDSIADIKNSQDSLSSKTDFEKTKQDLSDRYNELIDELTTYRDDPDSWSNSDAISEAINDYFEGKSDAWDYGFKVKPDAQMLSKIDAFKEDLKNAPTEYFEGKINKVVDIGAFKVAVVPNDLDQDALNVIQSKGLKVVEYDPKIEGDRQAKLNALEELKFRISHSNSEKPITRSQMLAIQNENNRLFGNDSKNVEFVDNITTPEGQNAYGVTQDTQGESDIRIARQQEDALGTYYHEAVHKVLNDFHTPEQRAQIIQSYKDAGLVPADMHPNKVEEQVADDFIKFVAKKENRYFEQMTLPKRVLAMFEETWLRIKETYNTLMKTGQITPEFKRVFEALYNGEYANREVRAKVTPQDIQMDSLKEAERSLQQQYDSTTDLSVRNNLSKALTQLHDEMRQTLSSKEPMGIKNRFKAEANKEKNLSQQLDDFFIESASGYDNPKDYIDSFRNTTISHTLANHLRSGVNSTQELEQKLQGYFDKAHKDTTTTEPQTQPVIIVPPKTKTAGNLPTLAQVQAPTTTSKVNIAPPPETTKLNTPKKNSRYASETVPESEFVDQEVSNLTKKNAPTYTPETEKGRYTQTLKSSTEKGFEAFENDVLERLNGNHIDSQTVADGQAVAQKLEFNGDSISLRRASEIYDKISAHLTKAGQTIQAAAIMSKRTPDGIRYQALKDLRKACVEINPSIIKTLNERTKEISKTKPNTKARKVALAKLAKAVDDNMPSNAVSSLVSVWKAGLLSGVKTTQGNLLSNATFGALEKVSSAPAALADKAMSFITGKRSTTLTTKGIASGAREGLGNALYTLKTGIDIREQGDKYEGGRGRIKFNNKIMDKTLAIPAQKVFDLMSASDQPFYYSKLKNSLWEVSKVEGMNKGLKGRALNDFAKNLSENPTERVMQLAVDEANKAVLGYDTAAFKVIQGGKMAINNSKFPPIVKSTATAVIDVLAPFTRVPTAFLSRTVDYTPLGLGKEILTQISQKKFDQRALSKAIGEGITGTGLIAIGVGLSQVGQLSGDYPDDPKEQQRWKAEGIKPNSVKFGDTWYSLNYFGPIGMLFGAGQKFDDATKRGEGALSSTSSAIGGFGQTLLGQSFLQGLNGFIEAINDPERSLKKFANSQAGSVIPAWLNDFANLTDGYQRDVNNGFEAIMNRIPGARQNLNKKQDVYGNKLEQNPVDTINALKPSKQNTDNEVMAEVRRLHDIDPENKDLQVTPTPVDKSIKNNGQTISLTDQQRYDIQERIGQSTQEKWRELIKTEAYQSMSDTDKAYELNKLRTDITAVETNKYMAENGMGEKKLTKNQQSLADGSRSAEDYAQGKDEKVSKDTSKYYESNDAEYNAFKKEYERKLKLNDYTLAGKTKAEKQLAKLEVGKDYSKNARDLYGMSKEDVQHTLHNAGDKADTLRNELIAYGDALVNSGLAKYNKFRDKYGNLSFTSGKATGGKRKTAGGGSKGGRKATNASSNTTARSNLKLTQSLNKKLAKGIKTTQYKGGKVAKTTLKNSNKKLKKYTVKGVKTA